VCVCVCGESGGGIDVDDGKDRQDDGTQEKRKEKRQRGQADVRKEEPIHVWTPRPRG